MDKETMHKAHPGYVEIIRNLCSDEALLLKAFISTPLYPFIDIQSTAENILGFRRELSNYSHLHKEYKVNRADLVPSYLDNLRRLGILEISLGIAITADNTFEPLENDNELQVIKELIKSQDREVSFGRGIVRLTSFGAQFIENVVDEKS